MAKDCPRCGLINPPGAQRCDCGYDFIAQRVKGSYLEPKQVARAAAVGAVGIGGAVLAFIIMRIIWRLVNEWGR